jgi:hypothetical protein
MREEYVAGLFQSALAGKIDITVLGGQRLTVFGPVQMGKGGRGHVGSNGLLWGTLYPLRLATGQSAQVGKNQNDPSCNEDYRHTGPFGLDHAFHNRTFLVLVEPQGPVSVRFAARYRRTAICTYSLDKLFTTP